MGKTVKADVRFLHDAQQPDEPTLSVTEVAEVVKLSLQSVRDNIRRGRFPHAHKAGIERNSAFVIPKCCVDNFVKVRSELTQVIELP